VTGERAATVTIARADGSEVRFATPLLGAAGALGCAAALAVSEALLPDRLDGAAIGAALAALGTEREGPGRLFPRQAPSGLLVLDDSYNANPASCRSSLEAAREVAASLGRRLVLVLGEMRELGAESRVAHEELGRQAASASVVVAVGGDARLVAEAASEAGATARFVPDATAAARLATELVGTDDVVLVKGSRAVGTEEVVRALLRAHGGSAPGVGQAPRQARGEGVAP
jgi:UDP-N-acetylmuramoyl-tripeptide--D-alanyl-D-alanine ligase